MKVFLSHSTKDADFVKQLAATIIGARSEAWVCEIDIEKHENFVAEIEKGLKWCDVALLIWSPDAAASQWTEEEWTSVLSRQVAEQKTRLGIVMLRDHPLPELLRTKNYIDARRDQQDALRQTVAWIEQRESVKRFLGLPEYRPQDFVGRGPYLQQLRNTFSGEPMVFLLHGEPGTGKTSLALQFAWDAQKDFDAVVFQTCGQRPLDAITAELVERLPIDVKTLAPDRQRDAAKQWLRQRQSLLVLDDVWPNGDGEIEVTQLEPGPACSVLYTSRLKSLPGLVPKQISQVEKFTEDEAVELFHTYLDESFSKQEVDYNRNPLLDFAARVEMLPIAVAVGSSLLRDKSAMALSKAASKLQVSALADGEKNVNALFAQAIESQPEREQKLLAACAVCVQEGFWLPLAAQTAELTEDESDDAANTLVRGSLLRVLDRDRQRFQLHVLLREQLRARAGPDGLLAFQGRHAAALENLFKNRQARWQDCRECLDEVIASVQFLSASGQDSRAGKISFWGYDIAETIGELDVAFRIVKDRGAICLELGNKGGLQASYGNQALILKAWGRLDEALALLKKQEEICLELGNKDGLQRTYGNQALILKAWGRLDEALALHKREEAIAFELGDKDGLQASYGNQALILQDWGRLDDAMALEKKKESICLELGKKDSLQRTYGNQALIIKASGRLDEALALHKKQEAICLELGNKDGLSKSYSGQGLILNQLGRNDEAMELYRKEEALCAELGYQVGLQRSYGNQANILIKQGQLPRALELLKKKEAICIELGFKSGLGYCYSQWADVESARGDHGAQKQKLQHALALFTELNMPIEHDAVQAALDQLNSSTN
jgi:tetratricopeptide (TPR) repeat protein